MNTNNIFSILCATIALTAFSAVAAEEKKPQAPAPQAAPPAVPSASPLMPNPSGTVITDEKAKAELQVKNSDYVLGDRKAKVTIFEYSSLSCPHCADFQMKGLPKLMEKYISTGKVNLVHRDFPLNEPALRASMVIHCAANAAPKAKRDETYYRYTKVLFSSQAQWALDPSFVKGIENITRLGGMTKEDFDACMKNQEIENEVLASRKTGADVLGVRSTPTFFIGNKKIDGTRSFEEFRGLIDPLLK